MHPIPPNFYKSQSRLKRLERLPLYLAEHGRVSRSSRSMKNQDRTFAIRHSRHHPGISLRKSKTGSRTPTTVAPLSARASKPARDSYEGRCSGVLGISYLRETKMLHINLLQQKLSHPRQAGPPAFCARLKYWDRECSCLIPGQGTKAAGVRLFFDSTSCEARTSTVRISHGRAALNW